MPFFAFYELFADMQPSTATARKLPRGRRHRRHPRPAAPASRHRSRAGCTPNRARRSGARGLAAGRQQALRRWHEPAAPPAPPATGALPPPRCQRPAPVEPPFVGTSAWPRLSQPSPTAGAASSGAGTGNGGQANVPTNGGSTGAGLTGSGAGGARQWPGARAAPRAQLLPAERLLPAPRRPWLPGLRCGASRGSSTTTARAICSVSICDSPARCRARSLAAVSATTPTLRAPRGC